MWAASETFLPGVYEQPLTWNGYYYECTTPGITGTTEPVWPVVPGGTVTDGAVRWTCRGFASYASVAELEARVGAKILIQIADDNTDGFADLFVVQGILRDSASKVNGYFRQHYSKVMPFLAPPDECKRLQLDVAQAYLARRFPTNVAYTNGEELFKSALMELEGFADGKTRLDVILTPEPAGNTRAVLMSDDETDRRYRGGRPRKVFLGGMGDF